jgi:quercetin dioxygenase-like cupin family protein
MVILSGEVFVKSEDGGERRYGPSDFIFFPAGSEATWRVPDHIRKIAILKNSVNPSAIRISKAWNKLLELAGISGKAEL